MEPIAPLKEVIEEIRRAGGDSAKLCYQCGKCDVVCPWNTVRNFSIRRLVRQASFGVPEIEMDDMWRCTTCGTCPTHCPRGVGQIEVGVALRRIATEYGVFPESARGVRSAAGSLTTDGNPLQGERAQRTEWANGLDIPPFTEEMEYLFFVGCYYAYDPRMKKVAVATAEILQKAGVSFGTLGIEENCCGESIRKAGNTDLYKTLARQNIKTFIDRGVRKILVASPHCFHTLANEYPEFRVSFEVVHISQLLGQLLAQGRLTLTRPLEHVVTYHDPCYLGRHNGVFEPPRTVLGAVPGCELREMTASRENSLCCGGGGGRIWMDTPKGERFADHRLKQAKAVGAQVLVTTCPYCISNFEDSRLALADDDPLVIKDLTEVVRDAL